MPQTAVNVTFVRTTSSKLSTVTVTDGQIIALEDTNQLLYDMNSSRHVVSPEVSTTVAGLMSTADKSKLNGIADNANNYVHPTYTTYANGLYKMTVDATGHISLASAVTKQDIVDLGIPSSDTTYSNFVGATDSAAGTAGLVPAPTTSDVNKFLKGDGTWGTASASHALTADTLATPRSIAISGGATGTATNFDGSQNISITVTSLDASKLSGTASIDTTGNAATASALATSRTIALSGDVSGSTTFDGSANATISTSVTNVPASTISGIISLANLPEGALERLVHVQNQAAMYQLTTDDVQLGDTVQNDETGVMYIVVDEDNLDNASGYNEYTSGSALTANTLATPRSIQTNLASTSGSNFDGSSNITPGVTGTLAIANGGTGATNATDALTNLGFTASITELNYMDGVTSSVQTQLDSKTGNDGTITAIKLAGTSIATEGDANIPAASTSDLGVMKVGSNLTSSNGEVSLTSTNVTNALGYTPPTQDTTYDPFSGASSSTAGSSGLVPAPATGEDEYVLYGDGTWGPAGGGGGTELSPIVVTIATSDWSNNTCTKTCTGVTSTNVVVVGPTPASTSAYGAAGISCTGQGTDSITFVCTTTPTSSIDVNVLVFDN